MQIRTFVASGAILCALIARHAWSSRPAEPPVVRGAVAREARVTLHANAVQPRARPVAHDGDLRALQADLEQSAAVEAERIATLEETLGTQGVLDGRIYDTATGEPIVGVTIIVSVPGHPMQAAISDETGWYQITELPPGRYAATYYYGSLVTEHEEVEVVASRVTSLDHDLDLDPPDDAGDPDDVPIPGRTFETVRGSAPSDSPTVSFTGCGTSLENRYYVDNIDVTGLTFGDAD